MCAFYPKRCSVKVVSSPRNQIDLLNRKPRLPSRGFCVWSPGKPENRGQLAAHLDPQGPASSRATALSRSPALRRRTSALRRVAYSRGIRDVGGARAVYREPAP